MKSSRRVPPSAVFSFNVNVRDDFMCWTSFIPSLVYLGLRGINHSRAPSSFVTYSLCCSSKHPVVIALANASQQPVMKGNKINKELCEGTSLWLQENYTFTLIARRSCTRRAAHAVFLMLPERCVWVCECAPAFASGPRKLPPPQ